MKTKYINATVKANDKKRVTKKWTLYIFSFEVHLKHILLHLHKLNVPFSKWTQASLNHEGVKRKRGRKSERECELNHGNWRVKGKVVLFVVYRCWTYVCKMTKWKFDEITGSGPKTLIFKHFHCTIVQYKGLSWTETMNIISVTIQWFNTTQSTKYLFSN